MNLLAWLRYQLAPPKPLLSPCACERCQVSANMIYTEERKPMDPNANLARQRELAESIVALEGKLEIRETGRPTRAIWHFAPELAELVLALDRRSAFAADLAR